jgi:RNA polymerase sigma factor (sigma-70 family)
LLTVLETGEEEVKKSPKEIYKSVVSDPKIGVKLLYENYGKHLYSYGIKSWALNEDESWELVYKTIYKVAEKTKNYPFNSESDYRSFIFTTFINNLKNYLKSKQRSDISSIGLEDAGVSLSAAPENTDDAESFNIKMLKQELDKLEDWERILLLMRCQNISYGEIAKFVNKPADQLKVYYSRLKSSMLKKLEQLKLVQNNDLK